MSAFAAVVALAAAGILAAPSLAQASVTTATVFDAGTNAAWAGTETTGASAYDTMTLVGDGVATPTGTVTYSFFQNGTCTGTAASTDPVAINANGSVPNSNPTGPLEAGTYSFQASYPGDANNAATTSACEDFAVQTATPTITTTLYVNSIATPWGSTVPDNASVSFSATVQGTNGVVPSGTVTFYGGESGCPASINIGIQDLSDGAASSQIFSGFDQTVGLSATYNGDSNYLSVASYCETFTGAPVSAPSIYVDPQNENAAIGGSLTFAAAALGVPAPTVQWQASVDGGASWITLSAATANTLTVGSIAPIENGWQVRAVFTNPYGTATTNAGTIGVIPNTSLLIPSSSATLSGTQVLDAGATSGVSHVQYEVTGGSLTNKVIVTASATYYGWLASWNTTNIPNGTYTLHSVASFPAGPQGVSGGVTVTVDNTAPSTEVVLPSNNVTISGTQPLDATASSGVTSVQYEATGGSLTDAIVATGSPTIYGWLVNWNTTNVPNGTYTLQSVASYFAGGISGASSGITVTVNNVPPTTSVVLPSTGATLSSFVWLDASASTGVTQVVYTLTGGSLNAAVVATATATVYGWLAAWNTSSVSDGTYTLRCVASYAGGVIGTSPGIAITVAN